MPSSSSGKGAENYLRKLLDLEFRGIFISFIMDLATSDSSESISY